MRLSAKIVVVVVYVKNGASGDYDTIKVVAPVLRCHLGRESVLDSPRVVISMPRKVEIVGLVHDLTLDRCRTPVCDEQQFAPGSLEKGLRIKE